MLEIKNDQELQSVLSAEVAVIDFFATWCQPCNALAPLYESLAQQYPNVSFAKVNAPEHMDIARQYGVKGMPTVIVFRKGQVHKMLVGLKPEDEYKAAIEG